MSDDQEPTSIPAGPPWSIDVLAALHAGLYPAQVSTLLRSQIAQDPASLAVLSALDSTVDELSLLPTPRMPERFALRLDAAIEDESSARAERPSVPAPSQFRKRSSAAQQPRRPEYEPRPGQTIVHHGPVPPSRTSPGSPPAGPGSPPPPFRGLTAVPPPRSGQDQPYGPPAPRAPTPDNVVPLAGEWSRRRRWIGGLAAAAAVVVIGTVAVTALDKTSPATTNAGGAAGTASAPAPAPANAFELQPGRFQDAYPKLKGTDTGPLTSSPTAAACYGANGIVTSDVLGFSRVTYEDTPASAIVVGIDAAHARIVVVGLQCGINGAAAYLASETVAR